jgi:hypothetical protein
MKSMRLYLSVLILLAGLGCSSAYAATNRAYFIGNSVTDTIQYDKLRQLAESRGHRMPWGRQMIPGSPLDNLWISPGSGFTQPPYGYPTNALPNYTWDFFSLQPFDRFLSSDTNSITLFVNLGMPHNSNMQVVVMSRWPRQSSFNPDFDGAWLSPFVDNQFGATLETREFFEQVMFALRPAWNGQLTKPIRLAPVGDVLYALNQKMKAGEIAGYTNVVQVYADGIHFNDVGQYICGCTYYTIIFKENPIGLTATPYGVSDTALVAAIQTTVWEVVSVHPHAGLIPEPLPMVYQVEVPEGGTATFDVKLSDPPAAPVTLTVMRESGDSDISVSDGGSLNFTAANYDQWQTVTLSAGEDADTEHDSAVIAFAGPGTATGRITAVEADNDASALCYEGFSTPTGALEGVSSGYGWQSAWQSASEPGFKVIDDSLTYQDLVTSGRKAQGGGAYKRAGRPLDVENSFTAWAVQQGGNYFVAKTNTPDLWMSYLVRPANASYSAILSFDDAISVVHDNNGILRVRPFGGNWGVSTMKGAFAATSSVAMAANTTYLNVLRIKFGETNEVDLFVNPTNLGGADPVVPDASLRFVTNNFRFFENNWYPNNNNESGWLDEIRYGNSFANVTPTMADVHTNQNNTTLSGVHENDVRSGYTIYNTGSINGTGTYVEATGVTNYYIGNVSPGYSAGTLTMDNQDGPMYLGAPGAQLGLEIENGDLLELTNMPGVVDLANIDVTFYSIDTGGQIHWFLTSDTGFTNEFNATNFVLYTSGTLHYDYANDRVGVTIVPEAAAGAAVFALLVAARRMKVRG